MLSYDYIRQHPDTYVPPQQLNPLRAQGAAMVYHVYRADTVIVRRYGVENTEHWVALLDVAVIYSSLVH